MTEHPFHADTIDEQIDQLSSSGQRRAASTDERLLHDIQSRLNAGDINEQLREDQASVQRVWTTITAKGIHAQATPIKHRSTEKFTIMSTPSSLPKRSTSWSRRLDLLSVAAITIVLLGSALAIFTLTRHEAQVTQQPNTSADAAPTATPTLPQGTTIYTYQQPSNGIYGLQWSPDGKRIISTSSGVYGWDAMNGANVIQYARLTSLQGTATQEQTKQPHLLSAQLSPDGKLLAVWNTTQIKMYDAITGKQIKTFTYSFFSNHELSEGFSPFSPYVSWSPDGKSLKVIAQLTKNGETHPSISKLMTYEVATREMTQEVTLNDVKGVLDQVRWSPDGKYVAAGLGSEGSVYVFDSTTGKTMSKHFGGGPVETITLSWSPDSKQVAASFENGIHIWDAATAKHVVFYQEGNNNPVWSPNGKYIAVVDGVGPSTVGILDAATGKLLYTYKEHKNTVYALAWSPDSVYIASGEGSRDAKGNTGTVYVWVARP